MVHHGKRSLGIRIHVRAPHVEASKCTENEVKTHTLNGWRYIRIHDWVRVNILCHRFDILFCYACGILASETYLQPACSDANFSMISFFLFYQANMYTMTNEKLKTQKGFIKNKSGQQEILSKLLVSFFWLQLYVYS